MGSQKFWVIVAGFILIGLLLLGLNQNGVEEQIALLVIILCIAFFFLPLDDLFKE